jgi:pyruvate dehydrogenase E2 component (dihydrolipoamide acetyltransferase)
MARLMPMPKLSDTMEEGAIAKWLKKVGDKISEGDPLAEIETDKATMEYEATDSGFILKLVVEAGGKTKVGGPIAVLGDKKDETFDLNALMAAAPAAAGGHKAPAKPAATPAAAATAPAAASHAPAAAQMSIGGRVKASPLAKKMAKDRGVDLSRVAGSGPNGRVIMKDVTNAPAGGGGAGFFGSGSQADQVIRVTMMRQTIAKRLLAGKNDAPHFYLTRSFDMTRVNSWREQLNAGWDPKSGVAKVSVNDIIMFICAQALKKHPMVNASWQGETITQYGSVHLAMAVALPEGLVTPVIRNCDRLMPRQIAAQTKDMAAKAKAGKLTNEEFSGGTFTISNLGMMGIEEFTAIINPPQAAILAVGATILTPVVDASGAVVVKPMMKVTMSCDHRVVDGMVGAQFLQTLATYMEEPLAVFVG